jgi:hypothetical protein
MHVNLNVYINNTITEDILVYIVPPKRAGRIQKRTYSDLLQDKSADLFCSYFL